MACSLPESLNTKPTQVTACVVICAITSQAARCEERCYGTKTITESVAAQ